AQKIRLNGMKASLSSPSAVFFELGEFPERVFFCPVHPFFFLNASVQKENGGNSQKRKTFLSHSHPSLNFIHAKRGGNSNSMRIRKGIIPLRGVRGWPRFSPLHPSKLFDIETEG
ncbi:hypothetical protein, partial [Desulfobaculum bizertense]|uniref:hypothetical protein n=1 Tax=Desulfobaculum bizertense TaxID=376490 RepID=UPI001F3B99F0